MTEVHKTIHVSKTPAYVKDYNSKYYQANKNYWMDYHECECGSRFNLSHKSRHCSSKKHRLFIFNKNMSENNKNYEVA
jgi:hypothetical protein